jgi:hypothetical protein
MVPEMVVGLMVVEVAMVIVVGVVAPKMATVAS